MSRPSTSPGLAPAHNGLPAYAPAGGAATVPSTSTHSTNPSNLSSSSAAGCCGRGWWWPAAANALLVNFHRAQARLLLTSSFSSAWPYSSSLPSFSGVGAHPSLPIPPSPNFPSTASIQSGESSSHSIHRATMQHDRRRHRCSATSYRKGACLVVALVLAAILFSVCCVGYMRLRLAEESAREWIPKDSALLKQREDYDSLFRDGSARVIKLIFEAPRGATTNMLSQETFGGLFAFHQHISSISVTEGTRTYDLADLCVNVTISGTSGCYQFNPLAFWPSGLGPGSFGPPSDILERVNSPQYLAQNPWTEVDLVIGGQMRASEQPNANITSATALQLWYFLDGSPATFSSDPHRDAALKSLEGAILASSLSGNWKFASIYALGSQSFEHEQEVAFQEDWPIVVAAIGVVLVVLAISFASTDMIYKSKLLLGISGACMIAIATVSTYGAAAGMGAITTRAATSSILLIVTFGLYHVYLLVHAYDAATLRAIAQSELRVHYNAKHDRNVLEESVCSTFGAAMPAITTTSVVSLCALLLSLCSEYFLGEAPIPGLFSCTVLTLLGVIFEYIFLNLIFLPSIVIDARRVAARRMDVVFLRSSKPPHRTERMLKRLTERWWVPFHATLPVRIIVFLVFIACMSLGIYLIASHRMQPVYLIPQDVLPNDSSAHRFMDASDAQFAKVGYRVSLVLPTLDYAASMTNSTIHDIARRLTESQYVEAQSVGATWYPLYLQYLAILGLNASGFYAQNENGMLLVQWLQSPGGALYALDVVLGTNGLVAGAQLRLRQIPLYKEDLASRLDAMHELRVIASAVHGIAYSNPFINLDQFPTLTDAFLAKLPISYVGATAVAIGMLGVGVLYGGIVMHYLRANFSAASVGPALMAPSLAFLPMFLVAYAWMNAPGRRRVRFFQSILETGMSLASGCTALLAGFIVLMAGFSSPANETFADLATSLTLLSFAYAFLVLPVIFSWIGRRIAPGVVPASPLPEVDSDSNMRSDSRSFAEGDFSMTSDSDADTSLLYYADVTLPAPVPKPSDASLYESSDGYSTEEIARSFASSLPKYGSINDAIPGYEDSYSP